MKIIYPIKFIIIICWVFLNKNINCCKTGCSCKKKGNKNQNNEIRRITPQKHIKNNKSLVTGNKKPKSNEIKKNTTEKTDEIKKNTTEKTNINNNYNGQSKILNDETHKNKNNKNIKKKDTNTISIKDEIIKNKNIKTNKANNDIQNKNNLINKSNNFDKNNNEINNINENYDKTSSYKKDEPNKINNETNNNLNNLQSNININININKSKIDINKSNSNDINKGNTTKNNEKIINTKNKNNISTTNLNNPKNNNNSDNKLNIPQNDNINPELNISENKNNTAKLNIPENKNNTAKLNIPENKNNTAKLNIPENKNNTAKSNIPENKNSTAKSNIPENKNNNNTTKLNEQKNNISTTNLNNPEKNNNTQKNNDIINPKSNIQNNNNTNLNNPENKNNNNTTESNIHNNNNNNSDKNNNDINHKLNTQVKNIENINKPSHTTINNLPKKNNDPNNNNIFKNLHDNNKNTINNDSNNNSNLNNNIKYNNDLDKKKEEKPDINNTTKIENITKKQLEHLYEEKNKKPDINYNNIHNPDLGINNIIINNKIINNKNLNNGNNNKNNIKANNIINNNSFNKEKHKKTNINNNQQKNKKYINVDPEYEEMYKQMSEYFKDDFIFELINERRKLKKLDICKALDNIITKNLVFIPYFKKNEDKTKSSILTHVNLAKKKKIKSDGITLTNMYAKLAGINEENFKSLQKKFIFPSGAIFIDNEYFKYLRCKGNCNNDNCVSCKLRNYLKKEKLLNLFISIYLNQGNSSRSEYSNYIKKIINEGLKEGIKSNINYYEPSKWNKKITIDDYDEDIKKCFFIEWALTIEFLTRFSKILSADGNLTLYRVVTIDKNEIKKISPYESTSIFGQPFIPQYQNGKEKCFIVERAEIWRCIFSYIISPDDKSMFYSSITDPTERKYLNSLDYELEIGYIPIEKEKYYKYNGSIDNAHNELEKKCKEFYNQNINKIYDKDKNLLLKFQNNITTLIEGKYEDYKPEDEDE